MRFILPYISFRRNTKGETAMDEFKLEVGGKYVDGRGEAHVCAAADVDGLFRCTGAQTGEGVYNPDGTLYGVDGPHFTRLRPIPQ